MNNGRNNSISRRIKRLADIFVAAVALIICAPVMAVAAFMILVTLGPPVIFRQQRAGLHGRPFIMPKFRTMTDTRDAQGRLLPDSQRMTRLGAFLRKTSIDELPQFWNVLKGDMSVIGPRPLPVEYLDLYTVEQYRRHEVPAGMMGWASVRGRNTNSWEKKFELDLWYVDNWSLLLDIKIFFMGIITALSAAGVNEEGAATSSSFTGSGISDKTD